VSRTPFKYRHVYFQYSGVCNWLDNWKLIARHWISPKILANLLMLLVISRLLGFATASKPLAPTLATFSSHTWHAVFSRSKSFYQSTKKVSERSLNWTNISAHAIASDDKIKLRVRLKFSEKNERLRTQVHIKSRGPREKASLVPPAL